MKVGSLKKVLVGVAALLATWTFAGIASAQTTQAPPLPVAPAKPNEGPARPSYILGPDDQLVIHAVDLPDISEKPQKVDSGGDLRLPMVGRIHVAGMTLEQLETELSKRLQVYLEHPDVTVTVTESQSQSISIIGAVHTSGIQQVAGSKTLIEVLSLAGGLTDDAGPTVKVTRRRESGTIPLPEAIIDPTGNFSMVDIDARALLDAKTFEKNILIKPYDVISVPRAELVYIVGQVAKPGPLPLTSSSSMSVMQAVSASGGLLRMAQKQGAILRRIPGQDQVAEVPVDIEKILQGKSPDVRLIAGDILSVPESGGKRVTAVLLQGAFSIALMAAAWAVVR